MTAEEVAAFTSRAREQEKPWFLLYNIPQPHRPYRNSDKVKIGVNPDEVRPPSFLPDTPVIRQDWAEYLDYCEVADAAVGQALDGLRLSGEEDNTIVIFMGDHGPCFQRGKMSLKRSGASRAPWPSRRPGIAGGTGERRPGERTGPDAHPARPDRKSRRRRFNTGFPSGRSSKASPGPRATISSSPRSPTRCSSVTAACRSVPSTTAVTT